MLHRERIHGFVQMFWVKMTWDQAFRGCSQRREYRSSGHWSSIGFE
jgi:hypothetical protein